MLSSLWGETQDVPAVVPLLWLLWEEKPDGAQAPEASAQPGWGAQQARRCNTSCGPLVLLSPWALEYRIWLRWQIRTAPLRLLSVVLAQAPAWVSSKPVQDPQWQKENSAKKNLKLLVAWLPKEESLPSTCTDIRQRMGTCGHGLRECHHPF